MKPPAKKPCNECPFRRKAAAGWLGPWESPEQLELVIGHVAFPCHRTIKEDNDDPTKHRACTGALQHLNNQFALSHDPEMAKYQKLAGKSDDVFQWPHQFNNHHNKGILR